MVKFIEKEEGKYTSQHTGMTYVPIYMVKDGKEFFVANRVFVEEDGKCGKEFLQDELECYMKFLEQHDYKYFKFYGFYDDPMEMIKEMKNRCHTFTEPESLFVGDSLRGSIDFYGNRNEVSAAFHYRIFDLELYERIKKEIEPILKW